MRHAATATIIVLALTGAASGRMTAQDAGVEVLVDFRSETGSWSVVNDGVMGGRSSSEIRSTGDGSAVFQGNLSLENNGGFASIRTDVPAGVLAGRSRLVIRVRGDGKRYQVRLRTSGSFDGIAYRADFETTANAWTTIEIPLEIFEPSFRGYRPPNAEPLDPAEVRQIGLMLTDKQEGPFRLEIAWIGAARSPR